jgi:predicted metal-dependent RNase
VIKEHMAKRRASKELEAVIEPDLDGVRINPLGAGQEVGRSCIHLSYQ